MGNVLYVPQMPHTFALSGEKHMEENYQLPSQKFFSVEEVITLSAVKAVDLALSVCLSQRPTYS